MANNNHKSKELFPETNAFFRGLFRTAKPEPPKTVRELRRAISASGLRHADCVERAELEKRYNDAVIASRDAPAKDGLEIEQTLIRAGAATLEVIDGLRCLCVGAAAPELVVVLYHGYGAHGVEFAALAALLCERLLPRRLQVVLPQCPSGESWFELDVTKYLYAVTMGEAAKARVVRATPGGVPELRMRQRQFLETLRRRSNVAPSQICLAGFSQGAMVAVDLALDAPEQYAGVVALSGFVMCVEDWARKLQSKKGLRVLQLHGPLPGVSLFASRRLRGGRAATDAGLEDRTIPYYTAPWLRDLLQTNGAQVTFLPHAAGHECGPASASAILAFLAGLF